MQKKEAKSQLCEMHTHTKSNKIGGGGCHPHFIPFLLTSSSFIHATPFLVSPMYLPTNSTSASITRECSTLSPSSAGGGISTTAADTTSSTSFSSSPSSPSPTLTTFFTFAASMYASNEGGSGTALTSSSSSSTSYLPNFFTFAASMYASNEGGSGTALTSSSSSSTSYLPNSFSKLPSPPIPSTARREGRSSSIIALSISRLCLYTDDREKEGRKAISTTSVEPTTLSCR
mmetsp:Transcript_35440/g.92260  ORF Transcript_35440/g.92260 Transcript_35440/m.92260 type:complete len:231 (+) Transcript_35440:127-819(+)